MEYPFASAKSAMEKRLSSYPAQPVRPCSFGAGIYGYILIVFAPLSFAILISNDAYRSRATSPGLFWLFVLLLLAAGFGAIFLGNLRIDISAQGVTYRNLFRERFVAFSDISTAVLLDSGAGRPELYNFHLLKLLVVPNPWTNQRNIKIPLTLFQGAACDELQHLLHTGKAVPPC
jgi:hypothetical protein